MVAELPLPIASFKLNRLGPRVRIVPERDLDGAPFASAGVDLVGDEAADALVVAAPVFAWLHAREAVAVRTLSLDVARLRVLVTLESSPRPRVVRIDPSIDSAASAELFERAAPLVRHLGVVARTKLDARRG